MEHILFLIDKAAFYPPNFLLHRLEESDASSPLVILSPFFRPFLGMYSLSSRNSLSPDSLDLSKIYAINDRTIPIVHKIQSNV